MRHFSICAFAQGEAQLPDHQVMLDRGINAFSVFTDDIDAVVRELEAQDVRVDKVYPLDEFEAVPASPDDILKTFPSGEG